MTAAPAHVLILDDDEGIVRLARRALERAGLRVSATTSAIAAREVLDSGDLPQLLILDYQLDTAQTGLDFFRHLRRQQGPAAAIPAILVTGFSDESKIIEALRAGIADVIPKAGEYLDYLPEAVSRVLAQARDRRAAAQAELFREREEHYRVMAEALPQLVWTARPDGNCDFLSKQWVEYSGIPEIEQLGLQWLDCVLHPDDRQRTLDAWLAAVRGDAPYDIEYRLRRADGMYRWFKVRGVPMRDDRGRMTKWFGTCTDVDDQRRALEERERLLAAEQLARRQAEEANQAKDRFLAMLSHELRTPLTPVLAAAELLERAPELPPSLLSDAQIIRRNVELEARLIDDLLDLTRVSRGKLQLTLETVDVHAAIRSVIEIFRADIEAKQLHLSLELHATAHHASADHARLQQMLWNLIKNAAKFTPERGTIRVLTRNQPADAEPLLLIDIIDTGMGIEADQLQRLFTAFEQGGERITRQYGGLGLGLAITKALVEFHNGTVNAASDGPGRGATFTLSLPTVPAPKPRDAGPVHAPIRPARSLRILLVEDHPDTARVMERLIRSIGHYVEMVGSATAAVQRMRDGTFDLLASDLGLPDGSGFDLIRAVRVFSAVPAIALSGFGMEEDVRRCIDAGFNAHLTKPVNIARLEQLIDHIAAAHASPTPGPAPAPTPT